MISPVAERDPCISRMKLLIYKFVAEYPKSANYRALDLTCKIYLTFFEIPSLTKALLLAKLIGDGKIYTSYFQSNIFRMEYPSIHHEIYR